jgi:hypothetical protein
MLSQVPSRVYAGWFLEEGDVVVLREDVWGDEKSSK